MSTYLCIFAGIYAESTRRSHWVRVSQNGKIEIVGARNSETVHEHPEEEITSLSSKESPLFDEGQYERLHLVRNFNHQRLVVDD